MRISFTGAQGVGKSTLIEALIPKFPGYKVQKESVRQLVKKYGFDFGTADPTLQLAILNFQTRNTLLHNNILLDRSVIDSTSYMLYYHKRNQPTIPKPIMELVLEAADEISNQLDLIIFMKPEFELVDDGFRILDYDQQKEITGIMEYLIDKFRVWDKTLIVHGSVEDRVQQVMDWISENGSNR